MEIIAVMALDMVTIFLIICHYYYICNIATCLEKLFIPRVIPLNVFF